jgi:hypothetical protein
MYAGEKCRYRCIQIPNAGTDACMHGAGLVAGSLVMPKVVKSVHYCPGAGAFTNHEYRDITSSNGRSPNRICLPYSCK